MCAIFEVSSIILTFAQWLLLLFFFFNCYLTVPRPTLGHSQEDSLTNPMLITVFVQVWTEAHWEPHNKVGYLSPAKHPAGFEPGTFRFWLKHLNPLGHSPWVITHKMFDAGTKLLSATDKQLKVFLGPCGWRNLQISFM